MRAPCFPFTAAECCSTVRRHITHAEVKTVYIYCIGVSHRTSPQTESLAGCRDQIEPQELGTRSGPQPLLLSVYQVIQCLPIATSVNQCPKRPFLPQERLGAIELDHLPSVEYEDLVRRHDCLQAMRHNDECHVVELGRDRLLDGRVGLIIDGRGRFVYTILVNKRT